MGKVYNVQKYRNVQNRTESSESTASMRCTCKRYNPVEVVQVVHKSYDLKLTYNFWPLEAHYCTFIWNRTFTLNVQVVSQNVQKVQKVRKVRINRTKGTPRTQGTMLITKNTYNFHILTFFSWFSP